MTQKISTIFVQNNKQRYKKVWLSNFRLNSDILGFHPLTFQRDRQFSIFGEYVFTVSQLQMMMMMMLGVSVELMTLPERKFQQIRANLPRQLR